MSQNLYKISLHYFLLIISCWLSLASAWWPREYPRIGLNRWLEIDQEDRSMAGRWRSDFENMTKGYLSILDQGRTYIVSPQVTGLGFECNATYPIQWVAKYQDDSDYPAFYTRVRYLRANPDVFNPRSNTFIASLDMYGDQSGISGNYSCVSIQNPDDVAKSIYVYWQGTNPSNLVLGGKTVEAQSKDGHYLILPCRVSRPDVPVNLYREVNSEWIPTKSPFIKFNPKFGYRINLYQYNGAYGRFKCAVGDDEDESLIINVKKGIKDVDTEFNSTIDGNATIYFNKTSQEIICCSSTSKPPKLHTLFCVEHFSCEIRRHQLHSIVNNGKRNNARNKSCTSERIYNKDSGLLRCLGDGIDVVKNFYSDLPTKKNNHSANLYFNWNDIVPENMVEISVTSRGPIFEHQNLTLSCDTAFNYFSEGIQWALRWKNQSLKFFPAPERNKVPGVLDVYDTTFISLQSLRLKMNRDMLEIICFVPVWNDTTYVNKSFLLDVQGTRRPQFQHPDAEELQWKLNSTEQVLECRVSGAPSPAIRWKKNNKTITHENNLTFKRQNGTSSLIIHRVSHDVHGEYRCTASNLEATVEKRFIVYVEEPSSGLGGVGLTFLILTILALIGGVGFLGWKMHSQKSIIDHLAGIVFRDVNSTSTTSPSTPNDGISNGAGVIHHDALGGSTRGNSEINPFPSSVG